MIFGYFTYGGFVFIKNWFVIEVDQEWLVGVWGWFKNGEEMAVGWHTQTLLQPVILHFFFTSCQFFSLILTLGWPSPQGRPDLVDRSTFLLLFFKKKSYITHISMYYFVNYNFMYSKHFFFYLAHTRFVEKALYSHELWKGLFLIMSYVVTYEFEFFCLTSESSNHMIGTVTVNIFLLVWEIGGWLILHIVTNMH